MHQYIETYYGRLVTELDDTQSRELRPREARCWQSGGLAIRTNREMSASLGFGLGIG